MKSILILPLLLMSLFTWTLGGCDLGFPGDREDCDGYPYVANDVLSDTVTLQVDGPPFHFDLAEAPVFKHTEGKTLHYTIAGNPDIVSAFISGPHGTVLEFYPRGVGTARHKVWAWDDCDKWDTLGVFVQVTNISTND